MDIEILAENSARTAVSTPVPTGTARRLPRRWRSAAAVALAAPLLLVGCADDTTEDEHPAGASEPDAAADDTPPPEDGDGDPAQDDAEDAQEQDEPQDGDDASDEEITRDGLADPEEELDVERTEDLGAFFSEEEACMTVGSTVDGLRTDMEDGLETEQDADGAYEAVEQTYLFVPEELRGPLEEIAGQLEADHDAVDTETVLTELEPLDAWMMETCDGQYHQQDIPEPEGDTEDGADGDADGDADGAEPDDAEG